MSTELPKYLTKSQLIKLLSKISNKRDKAMFTVAYCHGLRASEIGLLRVEDVSFEDMRIRIRRLKNSRGGEFPIQELERKALRAWLRIRPSGTPWLFPTINGTPVSRWTLDYLIKYYGKRAGTPEHLRHFHVLKHSIGTHLADAGADILFIQSWLGHKDIRNAAIYADVRDPKRDAEAARLFISPSLVT